MDEILQRQNGIVFSLLPADHAIVILVTAPRVPESNGDEDNGGLLLNFDEIHILSPRELTKPAITSIELTVERWAENQRSGINKRLIEP